MLALRTVLMVRMILSQLSLIKSLYAETKVSEQEPRQGLPHSQGPLEAFRIWLSIAGPLPGKPLLRIHNMHHHQQLAGRQRQERQLGADDV